MGQPLINTVVIFNLAPIRKIAIIRSEHGISHLHYVHNNYPNLCAKFASNLYQPPFNLLFTLYLFSLYYIHELYYIHLVFIIFIT